MEKEKKYLIDNPTLMAEWNWEKNSELGLTPKTLTCGSGKKVWWKCCKGHEWQATVNSRSRGTGCPYCYGRYAIKGKTDIATTDPRLIEEWNYKRNGDLKPEQITAHSDKKVWWRCRKGHEWKARIDHRSKGVGCPICSSGRRTSFPEYAIIYYLSKYNIEALHSYKEKGYELDIYIPSKKVAIEYDGNYWHKNKKEKELKKNLKCKEDGIKLYRIREGLSTLNDYSIDYIVDKNQKNLAEVIKKVLSGIIGINVDVNLKRDAIEIENLREYIEKANSLLFSNPELAKEWNYEKNGNLRPEHVGIGSGKKVWWKCSKGHEWQATTNNRNKGNGCPYCSGRYAIKGETDLATLNSKLVSEWNYERNGDLRPEQFTANSAQKAWWRCSKGHEWQATIASRNNGNGCPYCSGRYAIKGETDLSTLNSKLVSEWNYERNGDLRPEQFTANSAQKAWWRCSKGHEWQSSIDNRSKGRGCPYCSNKKVLIGYNDLATTNPKLASEWNYERNGALKPKDFTANSHKKVWWKCDKGHEWETTIKSRNSGTGCPYCSGRYAIKGKTDLITRNSELASEWNYEKNIGVLPTDVMPNSHHKVWWKCSKGHEWQATIDSRNRGNGCPYCSGRKKIKIKKR